MGFGSINGIAPLPPVVGPRPSSDVTGVFATEFSRRRRDDGDAAEESRRGLEGEEEPEELEAPAGLAPAGRIHIVI
jgi:hypothetical protein